MDGGKKTCASSEASEELTEDLRFFFSQVTHLTMLILKLKTLLYEPLKVFFPTL